MTAQVTILGSTGSIGVNTLKVLQQHPDHFKVYALTGNSQVDLLCRQCVQFEPKYAVVCDKAAVQRLTQLLSDTSCSTRVLSGSEALSEVAGEADVDIVVAAIVGAAGLDPTMAAVRAGKRVLLANKEALVMAGALFIKTVQESGATLLPVDSEHNAIFQCLPQPYKGLQQSGIRKLILTGSGGPFRTTPASELAYVTPREACNHPNWSMGKKISVDSATMMNKGLELIEACWLFDVQPDQVDIVIHPQSVIHSMVEYLDGSVLAQLGHPDMRTPIAHCLGWPARMESNVPRLNFYELAQLEFHPPDYEQFPCLNLAQGVCKLKGTEAIALNAANEVAVQAFLEERIAFTAIAEMIEEVLNQWQTTEPDSLDVVKEADLRARQIAQTILPRACLNNEGN